MKVKECDRLLSVGDGFQMKNIIINNAKGDLKSKFKDQKLCEHDLSEKSC